MSAKTDKLSAASVPLGLAKVVAAHRRIRESALERVKAHYAAPAKPSEPKP